LAAAPFASTGGAVGADAIMGSFDGSVVPGVTRGDVSSGSCADMDSKSSVPSAGADYPFRNPPANASSDYTASVQRQTKFLPRMGTKGGASRRLFSATAPSVRSRCHASVPSPLRDEEAGRHVRL